MAGRRRKEAHSECEGGSSGWSGDVLDLSDLLRRIPPEPFVMNDGRIR